MDLPISRTQLDLLGKRLVAGPTEDDYLLLQRVRAAYDDTLAAVWGILDDLSLDPVSRLKTVQSIVDKLAREKGMGLKGMQDIGGVRVVLDGTLRDQDRLVARLQRQFVDYKQKVIDRRANPTFGYRAVHLVVHYDGLPIEIQIRTVVQQLWAELSERLADQWGRQIRYGGPPDDPERQVTPKSTRLGICFVVWDLAGHLAAMENQEAEVQWALEEWDAGRFDMEQEESALLLDRQLALRRRKQEFRRVLSGLITAIG